MATSTQERIARFLEARAAAIEKNTAAHDGFERSRASQLRIEAASIRKGAWKG